MTDDATRPVFLLGIIDDLTDHLFVLRDEIDQFVRDETDGVRRFTYLLRAALAAATDEEYVLRAVDDGERLYRLRDGSTFSRPNVREQEQAWEAAREAEWETRVTHELDHERWEGDREPKK
jgi:hypothetical protein